MKGGEGPQRGAATRKSSRQISKSPSKRSVPRTGASETQTSPSKQAKLASVLATRLSYASWKVTHGLFSQNINEVENLFSDRFRRQVQERQATTSGEARTTSIDATSTDKGKASEAGRGRLVPSVMVHHDAGPAIIQHVPTAHGQTFFPYKDQSYHPYTDSLEEDMDANERFARPMSTDQREATPPPTHTMYSYLVSPMIGTGAFGFSPAVNRSPSRFGGRASMSYQDGMGYLQTSYNPPHNEFWKTTSSMSAGLDGQPGMQIHSFAAPASSQHLSFGTPGVSAPILLPRQDTLLPPAGILAKPQPLDLNPDSATSSSTQQSSEQAKAAVRVRHQTNHSQIIPNVFSTSEITFEDLDSQFGA